MTDDFVYIRRRVESLHYMPRPQHWIRATPPTSTGNKSLNPQSPIQFYSSLNHANMVTVRSFAKRQSHDGREFITLELVGGLEMVQSQNTGRFYATVRKCSIPATFGEDIATSLIGTKMEGEIVRIPSIPYEYTIKSSGEVVTLQHTYGYQPQPNAATVGNSLVNEFAEA